MTAQDPASSLGPVADPDPATAARVVPAKTGGPAVGQLVDETPDAMTLHTQDAYRMFTGRAADPALRIEVVPHGSAQPAVPYPALLAGLTAGEWNAVARQNNRVNITLLPAVPQR